MDRSRLRQSNVPNKSSRKQPTQTIYSPKTTATPPPFGLLSLVRHYLCLPSPASTKAATQCHYHIRSYQSTASMDRTDSALGRQRSQLLQPLCTRTEWNAPNTLFIATVRVYSRLFPTRTTHRNEPVLSHSPQNNRRHHQRDACPGVSRNAIGFQLPNTLGTTIGDVYQ